MINGQCTVEDPRWQAPCPMCPRHTPEGIRQAAIDRAAEQRYAASHRCEHRSLEPIREEPCACPSIAMLPIYQCSKLNTACADLRRPQPPATYCAGCAHHTERE